MAGKGKMTWVQHLLLKLGEEGSEISQGCNKSVIFGLQDVYTHISHDGTRTIKSEMGTNQDRLEGELNDLMAVVEMLIDEGAIRPNWEVRALKEAKKEKILRYAGYSCEVGILE